MRILRALAVGLAASMVACVVTPNFEAPKLEVVNVQLLKSDLLRQELRVRMRVQNPNKRMIPVRGISYQLEVAGDPIAQGESERDFQVPAQGTAEFDVNVTANAAGTILRLLSSGAKTDAVDYHLVGKVALASGLLRTIPFDQKGVFKLR
jgi:LEA14-like dessication related protein